MDCNDPAGSSNKSPIRLRDLISNSMLATLNGDFVVSDPAVCEGDDVYEVHATIFANYRGGGFAAAPESNESWMLPETELEFLRYIAGPDDTSYVEDFISYAEKNHCFGEDNLFLVMETGKTILNRQTKFVLHNPKLLEKTINYHVPNASKPSKRTDYVLKEWPFVNHNQPLIPNGDDNQLAPWIRPRTKPYNIHLNTNKVPIYAGPETSARHDENHLASHSQQQQQQQNQQRRQQCGTFFPQSHGHNIMFVYGPPPTTVVPWYVPGFMCQQQHQPWPNNFYPSIQLFPQPPPPVDFFWHPYNNTRLPPPVVTAAQDYIMCSDEITYSHDDDQQEQYDKNDFEECIDKIISTIETRDEDALRSFLLLLKNVYPEKLDEFNKIMVLMDFLNSQIPM